MRILGIDTSTSTASAAIVQTGQIIAEEFCSRQRKPGGSNPIANHSEIILSLVASVLSRAAVGLADVGGIAVSVGPGSFTGIRIGLSTVKGLVYGTDIPACGVSTLQAIAARVTGFEGIVCSLLDARKHEVYSALFHKHEDRLERLKQDEIIPVVRLLEQLRAFNKPCLLVGDGVTAYRALIDQSPDLELHIANEASMVSVAASVGRLSESQIFDKRGARLADLMPIYLRRPDCEFLMKVGA
jgi:tRNA threonylcarbamoyladenosine biosynthesis protein TsaB